jgi:acetyl-CoA carboxylase biotin carboxylase subunit
MFEKLVVANRGEIARRIFMACRELGVRSVAVYSEVDSGAHWTRLADESYVLPGITAADTYLNQPALLEIARISGADAIHPGYGFLSENAEFAAACAEQNIVFVGPSPEAIRIMGSKTAARVLAQRAGVPVVPGVDGAGLSDADLMTAATAIGYPVLIKASAGGGGKGMRVVWTAEDFNSAVVAARNEALSAFGNDHILVEKFFTEVHHVEIQVLADSQGNILHLFERECSIQRRHQKIIEESPAPIMSYLDQSDDLCNEMTAAATSLARAANYVGAGTVEFVVDAALPSKDCYYFLEMNTRLQVEHPVTELVTGVDLVVWQIRIAAGDVMPFAQADLTQSGHAIECRIYAEDPANRFMPSTGEISFYRPPSGPGVRIDDGIRTGTTISPHYDPMLAKVITWGHDRPSAIRKMIRALRDTVVLGVTTNISFMLDILHEPTYVGGRTSTNYLEEHMTPWSPERNATESDMIALAALELLQGSSHRDDYNGDDVRAVDAKLDPWQARTAWRNVK